MDIYFLDNQILSALQINFDFYQKTLSVCIFCAVAKAVNL